MNLYVTADQIGTPTGGGRVTLEESEALKSLGPCEVWGREQLLTRWGQDRPPAPEPWIWDWLACCLLEERQKELKPEIAHVYSGTFGNCVHLLRNRGTKVTYTVAAHDRQISKEEHEKLGIPFAYPHLVQEDLWQRYIEGYAASDVIVSPSTVAAATVRAYGPAFREKRIEVIPHGCDLPERTTQLPARFTCGYLGSYGADKGVRYLLEAWKRLAYKDAVLMLGGKDSTTAGRALYNAFGGGNVIFTGWVKNVSDFYNQLSLYVQPSATEGFGIEVLESMAHGRPVLCSTGVGAMDLVGTEYQRFPARNVEELVYRIDDAKTVYSLPDYGEQNREIAKKYTWDKVRQKYIDLWRGLL